jgi:hypothetical protein
MKLKLCSKCGRRPIPHQHRRSGYCAPCNRTYMREHDHQPSERQLHRMADQYRPKEAR